MRCRKNQASLSASEKSRYVAAVLALKANGKYDQYVADHEAAMNSPAMYAHRGPAFLPWHREFVRRFEMDLQAVDATVTVPYWDWSVDNSPMSSIWNADFMGGNGRPADGKVMTGAFAFDAGTWTLTRGGINYLTRNFGVGIATLPSAGDVTATLAALPYDVAPWSMFSASGLRNTLEGWINGPQMHNRVHVWVGGAMLPATSPNDPVFFLNHCFVDKLWADWQRAHPAEGYLPVTGAMPGQNLGDAMEPWASRGETVTPASVLDHQALGYAYDNEPQCRPKLPKLEKFEKLEKIEIKENIKAEKLELKEHKREKIEIKEIKENIKAEKPELKEHKLELKEGAALEKNPAVEGKLTFEGMPGQTPDPIQGIFERIHSALADLQHFISPELRPDLTRGALTGEEDVEEAGP
jgi:tyrosinase